MQPHCGALSHGVIAGCGCLESSEAASIRDIASEDENRSYVGRMLNLTLLAPDIVAAILDDTLPESLRLHDLAINPPMHWDEQRTRLSRHTS